MDATTQRLAGLHLAAQPAGTEAAEEAAAACILPSLPGEVLQLITAPLGRREKLRLAATCRRLHEASGAFWRGATIEAFDLWAPQALDSLEGWLAARRPAAAALRCAPMSAESCLIDDFEQGLQLPMPPRELGRRGCAAHRAWCKAPTL